MLLHGEEQVVAEIDLGLELEVVEKQQLIFHDGHVEIAVAHVDVDHGGWTLWKVFQKHRSGVNDLGLGPFVQDTVAKGFRIAVKVVGVQAIDGVGGGEVAVRYVEAEVQELLGRFGMVQFFGNEGMGASVDETKYPYAWDDAESITAAEFKAKLQDRDVKLAALKKNTEEYRKNRGNGGANTTSAAASDNYDF